MTEDTYVTIFTELCELTPIELDDLRADHPELGIPHDFSGTDMDDICNAILDNRSPGDAISLVLSYNRTGDNAEPDNPNWMSP